MASTCRSAGSISDVNIWHETVRFGTPRAFAPGMLKNASNIAKRFVVSTRILALAGLLLPVPRARGDIPAPVHEFYGEVAPQSQGTFIATTRIPLRAGLPGIQLGPLVSAGLTTSNGPFGSAGLHVSSPWIPGLPELYAAARIECRTSDRGGSCLQVSASGESRHGRFLRINADGDANGAAASAQFRTMFDAFRRPGLSLGAGAGAGFYRDEFTGTTAAQAITEIRWSPKPSLLLDAMAKFSRGEASPRVVLSFGGTL